MDAVTCSFIFLLCPVCVVGVSKGFCIVASLVLSLVLSGSCGFSLGEAPAAGLGPPGECNRPLGDDVPTCGVKI